MSNVHISPRPATDGSTTITSGGTAQFLFGGVVPKSFWIANPDASEGLWVSDSTTAAANATGSIYIAPLGLYESPLNYQGPAAVSVVAATTGHKITARYNY